ncbi:hydroxysqualene dehydroxylase [Paenibacillus roseipurpureus]|uniref:FAD-dependent oxidoreductase n=1 Tax=Paenibacillus roseopurpureus TaxID=2918901 RepID=A0AA96LUK1_9BACL|nr:FAD-dependent oxidoreductase [Paenibacillus sp. MBLB1832]WNR46299.1 FAD-dependent oxidoreductase [Paenibacillus sp. MBLB1832]
MNLLKKVAILGGGVAGLSAAHELILRGYQVSVYESRNIPGGKARSMPFKGSGKGGRRDLPGEHGFRLFPRFYRHVIDTLKRIPYGDKTVYDNLTEVSRLDIASFTDPIQPLPAKVALNIENLSILKGLIDHKLGLTNSDLRQYRRRLWQVMTSCEERIREEYDGVDWWDFIHAKEQSQAFLKIFAGFTTTLVACQSKVASTQTVGPVAAQMTLDLTTPGTSFVRLLNGPTNDKWIYPWMTYLQDQGVDYHLEARVEGFRCEDGRIIGVQVTEYGKSIEIEADYYIAAFPVEVMGPLISPEMLQADPSLYGVKRLVDSVEWMNGIQFYLNEDVTITHGHVIYLDAPWALTSVSQKQFWPDIELSEYGDGRVKGILSVDISDWDMPGILYGKPAVNCTLEEVKEEVWEQLKRSLNTGDSVILKDDMLHSWFLDSEIQYDPVDQRCKNNSPLFINRKDTWKDRPEAYTRIPNLFLASDYVRTNTNLATMEGANEAARRAVNAILQQDESLEQPCEIWDMYTFEIGNIDILKRFREHDKKRFEQGQPWNGKLR